MARLIILGSSNAIPSENHENTHMALLSHDKFILIDCVSNTILRLKKAGLDFNELTDLILTHFHPDHISGVPLLLQTMWLLGRTRRLNIYGLHHTLDRIRDLMGFFEWSTWPNFFPVAFHRLPDQDNTRVLENDGFRILSTPVRHFIPTIGLRVEFTESSKVLAYSCDTEPCPEVIELAREADVLLHEAHGASVGHSSAQQAAGIAREAGVKSLYLIHYPTWNYDPEPLVQAAAQVFAGEVQLARDFMVLEF
jgi:ribonuclease Z